VLVAPGTYYSDPQGVEDEAWIRMKTGVTLASEAGPEVTTLIKCPSSWGGINFVVFFDHVSQATLRGFTIRMYQVGECTGGGGVQFYGVFCYCSDALIENNIISGKLVDGIVVIGPLPMSCSPVIRNNVVTGCVDRGISCSAGSTFWAPWIEGNTITSCRGSGLYLDSIQPWVRGNLISSNYDGIFIRCPVIVDFQLNVITNNRNCGAWIWEKGLPYFGAVSFNGSYEIETGNDIYGNHAYEIYYRDDTGANLVPAPFNYWGSSCPAPSLFGRVEWLPWTDSTHAIECMDCETCGTTSTEPGTWGAIKAMFR
jgi:hypothetical protein